MVQDYNYEGVISVDIPNRYADELNKQQVTATSIFDQQFPFQGQVNVNVNQANNNSALSVFEQPVIPEQRQVDNSMVIENQNVVTAVDTNIKPKKELLIDSNPKSSFSEAIKSIRTNLQFIAVDKEIKVILVTSPEPGDGKSTVSSNLAGAFAQDDKKVLIIDCDLRKGRQAEIFNVSHIKGYTNLILNYITDEDKFNIEEYITNTDTKNIDLIPAGSVPPNPIELLSSEKNNELLNSLKDMYDIIILDCPPVLGLSDTLIMTKHSDANLVVISKGKTKLEALTEVKKSFVKANSSISGVVVNKAKKKHNSYYGYYGEV